MLAQLILMHEEGLNLARASIHAAASRDTQAAAEISSEESDEEFEVFDELLLDKQRSSQKPKRTVSQTWRRNFTNICVSVLKTIGHLLRANKNSRDHFKKVDYCKSKHLDAK
jgi:hypothetical protein